MRTVTYHVEFKIYSHSQFVARARATLSLNPEKLTQSFENAVIEAEEELTSQFGGPKKVYLAVDRVFRL
jgi:hypothetical protein